MEGADTEELCTLCGPFPTDESDTDLVTIYPMKVERKKAREELNVIGWRTTAYNTAAPLRSPLDMKADHVTSD